MIFSLRRQQSISGALHVHHIHHQCITVLKYFSLRDFAVKNGSDLVQNPIPI